ncbi:hypothetical protein D3C72_1253970 [compost metagenome]
MANLISEQIVRAFEQGIFDDTPKKVNVFIQKISIFDGFFGRINKYELCRAQSKFDETIFLCFGNVISEK